MRSWRGRSPSPKPQTVRRAVEILGRRGAPAAVPLLLGRYSGGADPYLAAEIARRSGGSAARTRATAWSSLRAPPVRHRAPRGG